MTQLNPISNSSKILDGVIIDTINKFVEENGGRKVFGGETTEEINVVIQKPLTSTKKVSYCDYILSVQKANVFISHAWK